MCVCSCSLTRTAFLSSRAPPPPPPSHWGSAYLTPSFFQEQLGPAVGDAALLVVAEVAEPGGGGRTVGAALNLAGSAALFGRNWGCEDEAAFPCLHFELCYYQAIEEAIACGLATVEAGAQGEHKVARGYLPTETHSAHLLRSPPFRALVANALEGERARVAATRAAMLAEASPYKRDADGGAPTSPADAADYDA